MTYDVGSGIWEQRYGLVRPGAAGVVSFSNSALSGLGSQCMVLKKNKRSEHVHLAFVSSVLH
jgi:hypothetical protein